MFVITDCYSQWGQFVAAVDGTYSRAWVAVDPCAILLYVTQVTWN